MSVDCLMQVGWLYRKLRIVAKFLMDIEKPTKQICTTSRLLPDYPTLGSTRQISVRTRRNSEQD